MVWHKRWTNAEDVDKNDGQNVVLNFLQAVPNNFTVYIANTFVFCADL